MSRRASLVKPAAIAALVVAAASTAFGATRGWPRLESRQQLYAGLDEAQAERFPANDLGLDPAAYDWFKAQLKPRERYYLLAPESGIVTISLKARSWAWYWLAPAIEVGEPKAATAIVSYDDDPNRLGVPLARIVRFPGKPQYSVAWVRR